MSNLDLLEPKTRIFIESLSGTTPLYKLTPTDARQVLLDIQKDTTYKSTVDIEDITVPSFASGKTPNIPVKIFRPKNNREILPVIIYCHGGGWVLGNSQTHGRLMSLLANGINAAVVYIDYTPAPEENFPIQIIQANQVLKYIAANGAKHKLDTNRLTVMGDSVGGNMATIITLMAVQNKTPKITCLVLLYPVTDASMDTVSYYKYETGPWLSKAAMEWFFDQYVTEDMRQLELVSPINTPSKNLEAYPPTLIVYGENDPLASEVEAYSHLLITAGVDVAAVKFLGTIHDFLILDPLKDTPATKEAMTLIIAYVKNKFDKKN